MQCPWDRKEHPEQVASCQDKTLKPRGKSSFLSTCFPLPEKLLNKNVSSLKIKYLLKG